MRWDEGRAQLAGIFARHSRDHWVKVFESSDACVAPVLSIEDSFNDAHMTARGTYQTIAGHLQAGPVPRFSRTTPDTPGPPQKVDREALKDWLDPRDMTELTNGILPD